MSNKGNSSDWIAAGKQKGIDVSPIYEDKERMFDMLEQLGLPTPKRFYFLKRDLELGSIDKLFESDTFYFCRLIPKNKGEKRPYHVPLTSINELHDFCDNHRNSQYIINLVEELPLLSTGSIIAIDDITPINSLINSIIELVHGSKSDIGLFHGKEIPINAEVDLFGIIRYKGKTIPSNEDRRIIYNALRMIGGPKHPLPGYYEWFVCERKVKDGKTLKEIIFRNYQAPSTWYNRVPSTWYNRVPSTWYEKL